MHKDQRVMVHSMNAGFVDVAKGAVEEEVVVVVVGTNMDPQPELITGLLWKIYRPESAGRT